MRFGPEPSTTIAARSSRASSLSSRRPSSSRAWRGELGAAGVDRVVGRAHAQLAPPPPDGALVGAGDGGEVAVGEARPGARRAAAGSELAERPARGLAGARERVQLADEPGVDAGRLLDLAGCGAAPPSAHSSSRSGRPTASAGARGPRPDRPAAAGGRPSSSAGHRLAERLAEGTPERQHLADALHVGGPARSRRRGTSRTAKRGILTARSRASARSSPA